MNTPHWHDCCRHDRPLDKFIGTFVVNNRYYDLWVYQDNALGEPPDMNLCIRYGNEDSNYISPGPIDMFLESTGNPHDCRSEDPVYREARKLLVGQ
jgi:hypothetical protein